MVKADEHDSVVVEADETSGAKTEHMLTTIDNPWNPFTQTDEWRAFDLQKGYNSEAYLARVAFSSPALSDADEEWLIELAIDEIVDLDPFGLYIKVTRDTWKPPKSAAVPVEA